MISAQATTAGRSLCSDGPTSICHRATITRDVQTSVTFRVRKMLGISIIKPSSVWEVARRSPQQQKQGEKSIPRHVRCRLSVKHRHVGRPTSSTCVTQCTCNSLASLEDIAELTFMCSNARRIQSERAISGINIGSLQSAGRRVQCLMLGLTSSRLVLARLSMMGAPL